MPSSTLSSSAPADLFRDRTLSAPDGLRLHVRDYGPPAGARTPVLCLPGLTRTVEDFDVLAAALATHPTAPRRVVALDLRGRGLSERDSKPENYNVPMEAADVIAVATALDLGPVAIVGTSRGGLIAMALAALQPGLLAGVVFNDVGPALDMAGLTRIRGYAGRITRPRSWAEAAANHKILFGRDFPNLNDADWMAWAKRAWKVVDDRFVGTCDPRVADSLTTLDPAQPLPPIWNLYDALPDIPLMVIRGGLSDLLSVETVAEMKTRRPALEVWEVPDQGHAPLLEDEPTVARIAAFLERCDASASS